MKVIAVTGTSGVGKTKYAKQFAKQKHYLYFDLGGFIKRYKLYDSYDRSLRTYVVDIPKLILVLRDILKGMEQEGWKGVVIDGHLSHYLPRNLVDKVIVLRCSLPVLRKRLERKKYSQKKIAVNMTAEIMETCLQEAREQGHNVKVVRSETIK